MKFLTERPISQFFIIHGLISKKINLRINVTNLCNLKTIYTNLR